MRGRCTTVLGITAPRRECTDVRANLHVLYASADSHDFTGDFQAQVR